MDPTSQCAAGFWVRFTAFGIDLGLVPLVSSTANWVAGLGGFYVPWEASTLVLLTVYSAVLIGRNGATLGKHLCGLSVRSRSGTPVNWWQALMRESVGKAASGILLGWGFIQVGLNREKRGCHDLLAGTHVVRDCARASYVSWLLAAELVILGVWILRPTAAALSAWKFAAGPALADRIPQRDPARLVEVTTAKTNRTGAFQQWIIKHARDPTQYVVEVASSHELTLIGECHNVRQTLDFLESLVPDLYRQAGVRCLALEFCLADDNALLERTSQGACLRGTSRFTSRLVVERSGMPRKQIALDARADLNSDCMKFAELYRLRNRTPWQCWECYSRVPFRRHSETR